MFKKFLHAIEYGSAEEAFLHLLRYIEKKLKPGGLALYKRKDDSYILLDTIVGTFPQTVRDTDSWNSHMLMLTADASKADLMIAISKPEFGPDQNIILHCLKLGLRLRYHLDKYREELIQLRERGERESKRITHTFSENIPQLRKAEAMATFVFDKEGKMAALLDRLEKFALADGPILLAGETGTGKEQIARMAHALSLRRGNFVGINCSAIPPDLLENELFGHIKGAYTGAIDTTIGLIERAESGTLFLDEIGELSALGQTKLLRLLQEGEFEKLGSSETEKANCRFIFATNKDLKTEVDEGRFRLDLFYRISAFELKLLPLRDRKEDIPLLAKHFLWLAAEIFKKPKFTFDEGLIDVLAEYDWPGNVRELENAILRMCALAEGDLIHRDLLPDSLLSGFDLDKKKKELESLAARKDKLERELIIDALSRTKGNRSRAAKILGISRGALHHQLRRWKRM